MNCTFQLYCYLVCISMYCIVIAAVATVGLFVTVFFAKTAKNIEKRNNRNKKSGLRNTRDLFFDVFFCICDCE